MFIWESADAIITDIRGDPARGAEHGSARLTDRIAIFEKDGVFTGDTIDIIISINTAATIGAIIAAAGKWPAHREQGSPCSRWAAYRLNLLIEDM